MNSIKAAIEGQASTCLYRNAANNQTTQIADLQYFIAQKVDVIILVASVDTGWDSVLGEAKDAGIPVVLVDRNVTTDADNYTTYIASDFANEGKQVAIALGEKISSGEVVEIEGTNGASSATLRKEGFDGELEQNYPNLNIIDSHDCRFTRSDAESYLDTAYFSAHPNVRAIFAHNDDMALGVIAAIKAVGKTPGTDIVVVSVDAIKEALQAVFDGKLYYTYECSPLLGALTVEICNKAAAGIALEKRYSPTEQGFRKADLTQDFIDARSY